MDAYEQEIFSMKTEAHKLRLENEWLKKEIMARNGGKPIELPPNILRQLSTEPDLEMNPTGSRKSKLSMLKSKGPRSQ